MKGDIQLASFADNPADGDHFLNGLDNAKSYVLVSLSFTLITDVTVSTRTAILQLVANGVAVATVLFEGQQTASLTRIWSMLRDGPIASASSGNRLYESLPRVIIPPQSGRLNLLLNGANAADAISEMRALVMEL